MKILHIVSSMDPKNGGVVEAIRNIALGSLQASAEFSVENHVVCFDDKKDILKWQNIALEIHAIGNYKGPWEYNAHFKSWLYNNYKHFDVMVIHGMWVYHGYLASKFIESLKKMKISSPRIFLMPHGMLDPWFQKDKTRKLKAIRNMLYWQLIQRKIVNTCDGILFTCSQEMRLAKKTFKGYHPKRELIVGLGIKPPPQYTHAMKEAFEVHCPLVKNKGFILFLGRVDYKKGVDLLINAYSELFEISEADRKNIPHLVVAGPGMTESYGKDILDFVNNHPFLSEYVHFVGMVSGDVKWGAIYGCDVFILPSHQENFGIAVVEALACGKPVLISDQVNIFHEIEVANAGIISKDSLEGVESLLNKWLQLSMIDKKIMCENALKLFDDNFTIQLATKNLINSIGV